MSHLASEQFRHDAAIPTPYLHVTRLISCQLLLRQGERLSKSRGKCRRRIKLQEAEKWSSRSSTQERWRTSAYLAWRSQGRPGRICTEGKIAAADLDSEGFEERLLRLFEAWAIQRPDLAKAFVSGIYGIRPNRLWHTSKFSKARHAAPNGKMEECCARRLVLGERLLTQCAGMGWTRMNLYPSHCTWPLRR